MLKLMFALWLRWDGGGGGGVEQLTHANDERAKAKLHYFSELSFFIQSMYVSVHAFHLVSPNRSNIFSVPGSTAELL